MKKELHILIVLLLLVSLQLVGQARFSEQALTDDLLFYQSKLERYHPNLYVYCSREEMDGFFDQLIRSISHPLTEAEFYQSITQTSHLVRDGHTLLLPSNSFVEYHNANSRFLPLQIGINHDQLYVKMNGTPYVLLEDGTIIDRINGIASQEIIKELLDRQVRDGNNLSYSRWIIDTYFREYYSYTFGHPEVYELSYTQGDVIHNIQIPALPKDSIYQYRSHNYPNIYSSGLPPRGIYVDYDHSKQIALLTIKDFHTVVLKNEFSQNFRREIKSIFENIVQVKPNNLVIDLRNNQGGDIKNGVLLLSYLIHQPFKVVEEYYRMKKGKMVRCKGPSQGYHKPNKNRFTGQIYVLINGGSFSNSVIVSSCLKEHTNALFIGTETGGNPTVLAGNAKEFELPNTRIRVEIPTKQFIMTDLKRNDGNGLIPTYKVENSIQDNIHHRDKPIEYVMMLIEERNRAGNQD